ncbi:Biopolymer transport protein exbD [Cardinium endosymbiont of Sogatella furcifera]|uniref:ExbD/TolR family protein n=1 Tax=Cardinium endosymbiont of Sogatella furcifera TaxID=650378 RepID=UPI000E0CC3A6|nr:biopolymer transporter ExbD [Cardinium endosymbiont of Sogatella furcifera]AXI24093.1 Biopolymer transport protein exbD [Cardinium endosymbiont of Sogatella furcifera]
MKISTKNKINASFSMASMTDIIFLLLIFLLITASYNPKALPVDLPLSTNEKTESAAINVTITAQLVYYVEGKRVAFHQLQNVLQDILAKTSNKVVVLHMDKGLAIAHMVKVADMANQLGAAVAIATEFEKKR